MSEQDATPHPLKRFCIWGGVIIPALLFALIVLFAPLGVLTNNPKLAAFCNAVERVLVAWIPGVDFFLHARSSEFPEVAFLATAYACAWWLWMTVVSLIVTMSFQEQFRGAKRVGAKGLLTLIFVGPPVGLFCFFAHFGLADSMSRWFFALSGIFAVLLASWTLATLPVNLISLFADVVFSGGKQKPKYLR